MKKRKKVAILVGNPDKDDQRNFIEGFLAEIFGFDMDVLVFGMYQMYQNSENREIGDSSIFSLVPYDKLDAIVVLADTIQTPGVVEHLESELASYFKGTVLFADKQSDNYRSLIMDDYTLTKKLISHLIEEHGYKDIAYLTGKSWNIHSITRLQAFRDCMAEHGIEVREDRIFYGDFWYSSGATMVDKLMNTPDDLPEAIACANNCMAIGVAKALDKNGIKVPEDIALTGYDSSHEGVTSPRSVTAMNIPYNQFGRYCADSLIDLMAGKDIVDYVADGDIYKGDTCGCTADVDWRSMACRDEWTTDTASIGFYSNDNPMMDDILCQTKLKDLFNVASSYTYQLGEFDSFNLCLNKYWAKEKELISSENDWNSYSDEMLLAVSCNDNVNDNDAVNLNRFFKTTELLPELNIEADKPRAFFFTPLFFEERCMGYAVVSYGDKPVTYTSLYRAWVGSVMRGLECARRTITSSYVSDKLEKSTYLDQKTGLDNYNGLMKNAQQLLSGNPYLYVLSFDIKGMSKINRAYGRDEGNKVISRMAEYIRSCDTVALSCCLGNDEYVLVSVIDDNIKSGAAKEELLRLIKQGNDGSIPYMIDICEGEAEGAIEEEGDLERLINEAVSQKNGNKVASQRMQAVVTFTDEEKQVAGIVQNLLSNNLFTYHFQPIISAKTGDIYSYEALMRSNTEIRVSPLDILKYAGALQRLNEVEKYTFSNVLAYIRSNKDMFEGKKVFINSIPGVTLSDEDLDCLNGQLKEYNGQIVIELTEQAELGDEELERLKQKYTELGVEMAVDDYGTGYSNVTNLLRYMPRYVKIDRMLLSDIQDSPQKQHFVKEIIEFAHSNDILALAEGIETAEEMEMVIHLGADLIQGYYVARPSAEVLQTIPVKVKREIRQFNIQKEYNKNRKAYVAGREFRISLAKLMSDEYERIIVPNAEATYRDLSIVGVPGARSNILVQIEDGYRGRIILEDVILAGKRGLPCINIGENCDVTLALQGDNELRTGGIRVPSSSKLVLEGEGSLDISCNYDGYFGIGNDMDQEHGDILFNQSGTVAINGNGTLGVAVGSGLGGNITVSKGKLIVEMTGKEGVAIGSISGSTNIKITYCDVFMNCSLYSGIGIGTMNGHMDFYTERNAISGKLSGTNMVGIGSHTANDNNMDINNCNISLTINSLKTCAVGAYDGISDIFARYSSLNLDIEGSEVSAIGGFDGSSLLTITNGELEIVVSTDNENNDILSVKEENCQLSNGSILLTVNGKEIYSINKI